MKMAEFLLGCPLYKRTYEYRVLHCYLGRFYVYWMPIINPTKFDDFDIWVKPDDGVRSIRNVALDRRARLV